MPNTSSPVPRVEPQTDRAIEAPELIQRLAEELRVAGGNELPHAFYVEQVKLQLAGRDHDDGDNGARASGLRKAAGGTSASVFAAWAMPETQTG